MRTLRLSLVGTVTLVLVWGLGGAALAQDEASEPTTPAFFRLVEDSGDSLLTTDPRFSGTSVATDPYLHFIGHDRDHVYSGLLHLQNEQGAWKGWITGFSWGSEAPWHEQMWFVGEGAYEGLSAVVASRCEQLPCGEGDTAFYGIIYEGDVPPLGPPAE